MAWNCLLVGVGALRQLELNHFFFSSFVLFVPSALIDNHKVIVAAQNDRRFVARAPRPSAVHRGAEIFVDRQVPVDLECFVQFKSHFTTPASMTAERTRFGEYRQHRRTRPESVVLHHTRRVRLD